MILFVITILFQSNFKPAFLNISKPDSLIEYGQQYQILLTINFVTLSSNESAIPITVSDEIEVKLTGLSFKISPNKPALQNLANRNELNWSWLINPEKIGKQYLQLEILSTVHYNNLSQKRIISNYKTKIYFQVNTSDYIKKWLSDYGSVFGIGITLLIAIFLMFQFKKNSNRLKSRIQK